MNCEQVAERLSWLVNGTIEGEEREAVHRHLATCDACRRELEQTREAADVFGVHIPAGDLVAYAFGAGGDQAEAWSHVHEADRLRQGYGESAEALRAKAGASSHEFKRASSHSYDTTLIERHLEHCAACRDELALIRESRALDPAGPVAPAARPRTADLATERRGVQTWWRYAAAVLVAFTGVNVWLVVERRQADARIASLESETQRLAQERGRLTDERAAAAGEVSRLQSEVARLSSPQINAQILEVFPEGLTLRSGRGSTNAITIPANASSLTLLLNAQSAVTAPTYALEMLDAKDRIVWRASGLVRHSTGDYTITLPATFLRSGLYRIRVYAERGTERTGADEYRLRIR